jgi:8-oxo-dGTP diphosphatase
VVGNVGEAALDAGSSSHDWLSVPHFGSRPDAGHFIVRPSAYRFAVDRDGRLAVVRDADGVFLPGGGIEPGETPEQAVIRELLEECGLLIEIGACVARAVQLAPAADGTTFEKRSYFFDARIGTRRPAAMLPGHETLWVVPLRAAELLSHESQAWAVRTWIARRQG